METQPKLLAVMLQGILSLVKPCQDHRAVSAPGFCQNCWHQPHENLESRGEIELIELNGDQDSQRSEYLYLELEIFPWHSTTQFLPPVPIFVDKRGDSKEVLVVDTNSFTIGTLRFLHVTKIKMYSL